MNETVKSVVNILVWLQDLWYYRYITFKKGVDKRMEIEKAYEVLYEYFSKGELQNMYREKGFDGSETDTIRKHKYYEHKQKQPPLENPTRLSGCFCLIK